MFTRLKLTTREPEELRTRTRYFLAVALVVFLVIAVRLWYLQVVKEQQFRLLSENNRIRLRRVPAVRGMILDRHGRVLADNRPAFDVTVMREDVNDVGTLARRLSSVIGFTPNEIISAVVTANHGPFRPVRIKRDISGDELNRLKIHSLQLPGVEISISPVRMYPQGAVAAHLMGYVGEVDRQDLVNGNGYQRGDRIGKCGIELLFERYLRGTGGGRQVEVDALGRELSVLDEVAPVPGHNLYLTIDLDLQEYAEELLSGKTGAIVAMNPANGEILVYCSSPRFEPRQFADGISAQEWEELLGQPMHPLQDRCIRGLYPPGSVFKIVTAAAALEEGVVHPNEKILCTGTYFLGGRAYRCWRDQGHGMVDFFRGIEESCDVYFYNLGRKLGVDALSRYATECGFGTVTGIELGGEKEGVVPSREWKLGVFHEPWYPGETISMSIGQGYTLVTPIQMAAFVSALANGGVRYKPLVAKRVQAVGEGPVVEYGAEKVGQLPISPETRNLLERALVNVVHGNRGTGRGAQLPGIRMAGKTGTAQVVKLGEGRRRKPEEMPYEYRDHAWFVAYAPVEEPEIAVVVLVEHGGHGGSVAAPLAREIIARYFSRQGLS
jgi:penicillin-binding protein 2